MKRNWKGILTEAVAAASLAPMFAFAQGPITAPNTVTNLTGLTQDILCKGINWVFTFLIIIAIIFILVAAFEYLTAGGNDEKISKAHKRLIYAAVAIVVGILAKGFPYLISSFIGSSFGVVCN
ncbi:MAG: hypothetical protein HY978_03750 [Candidatus Liptonbacteria bacterium]|nr:hypothetical protein [Candidatus Liptonbacteria bacterium]